jgi:hypothetical protein
MCGVVSTALDQAAVADADEPAHAARCNDQAAATMDPTAQSQARLGFQAMAQRFQPNRMEQAQSARRTTR